VGLYKSNAVDPQLETAWGVKKLEKLFFKTQVLTRKMKTRFQSLLFQMQLVPLHRGWLDFLRLVKEKRETQAMRTYIKTYQGLISKHIGGALHVESS
jgi:hypothetical protein